MSQMIVTSLMILARMYLWASERLILSHGTHDSNHLVLVLPDFSSPSASLAYMLLTWRDSLRARSIPASSPSFHDWC